jgi:hypothetical protein
VANFVSMNVAAGALWSAGVKPQPPPGSPAPVVLPPRTLPTSAELSTVQMPPPAVAGSWSPALSPLPPAARVGDALGVGARVGVGLGEDAAGVLDAVGVGFGSDVAASGPLLPPHAAKRVVAANAATAPAAAVRRIFDGFTHRNYRREPTGRRSSAVGVARVRRRTIRYPRAPRRWEH